MDKPFSLNDLSHDHQQLVEAMKSQLLIVFINRLGGKLQIPVSEVDGTGDYVLKLRVVDERAFEFDVVRKDGQPHNPPVKLTELNEHTRFILGRPNFLCSGIAEVLRRRGHDIGRKSEDEQAAVLHYFLNMFEQHGDQWKDEVDNYLFPTKGKS